MKCTLLSPEDARSAIETLNSGLDKLNHPDCITVNPADVKYSLNWHKHSIAFKSPFSHASVQLSGNFDDSGNRHFRGEIRLFLTKHEDWHYKFEAMIFGRLGKSVGFKSHNLLDNQKQEIDCPFIYGDSIEEVIEKSITRLNEAIKRAESMTYELA